MAVRRRGKKGIWWYDFTIKGIRYRGPIPDARLKKDAEETETDLRRKIYQGEGSKPMGGSVFVDYAEGPFLSWSRDNKRSWKDDRSRIKAFREYFGVKKFSEITPMLVEKYKRDRKNTLTRFGTIRTAATVNRELELMSVIFNRAIKIDRLASVNPCSMVQQYRENNTRTRYLTNEEETRLMAAFTGRRAHLRPIVVLAIHTGMRQGELLSRQWSHVDFNLGVIRVTDTKNGIDRAVPMNDVVRQELMAQFEKTGGVGPVFPSTRAAGALVEIKKGWMAARSEAGLGDVHFHDLRHTFGTRLAELGNGPFDIAELMGHSDLRMTKRYTHATSQSLRRAVDSLANNSGHKSVTGGEKNMKRKAG
jgi:integrase